MGGDRGCCDKSMNPELYQAARYGDTNFLRLGKILDIDQQATRPTSNTALHIAVSYGQDEFLRVLCSQYPSLLTQPNSDGDTPLHVAARTVNEEMGLIASFLISRIRPQGAGASAAEKLRMRNKDNYMPLHEAVQNNNLQVAKLLMKADPCWPCYDNDADKSLLYFAAQTGDLEMVQLILEKPAAYGGPKGEKALYEAAARNQFDIVEELIEKKIQIIRGGDEHGKTALHYAAEFGQHEIVEKLILKDPSSPYKLDKNGHSPLHIAAREFQPKVVEEMIKHCPDCIEQLSQEGESILHFAVKSESLRMVIYVVDSLGLDGLMNKADMRGNTPFHVSAKLTSSRIFFYLAFDGRQDTKALNRENQTAFQIQEKQPSNSIFSKTSNLWVKFLSLQSWREWFKKVETEEQDDTASMIEPYKQTAGSLGTIATLIAIVTFASALQVPGGFSRGDNSIQGMALAGDPFFEDFMIADTIAMVLSLTAMFLILFATYFNNRKLIIFMEAARILTFLSFMSLGMAFMEGFAAVLPKGYLKNLITRGYGIAVWCPYFLAIVGFLIFLYPLVVPTALLAYQYTPHRLRRQEWYSKFIGYICCLYR